MELFEVFCSLAKSAYTFINIALFFLAYPFVLLKHWFVERLEYTPRLKSVVFDIGFIIPYVVLISCLVYIGISISKVEGSLEENVFILFLNTAGVRFLMELPSYLFQGISIDWFSICASVIPGFFVAYFAGSLKKRQYNMCTGTVEFVELAPFWRVLAVVFYTALSIILMPAWESVIDKAALWLGNLFTFLTQFKGLSFFAVVGKALAWIPFVYVAVWMVLIAIKEIGEIIFYGIVCFLFFIVLTIVFAVVDGLFDTSWSSSLEAIYVAMIVVAECARHYIAETFLENEFG